MSYGAKSKCLIGLNLLSVRHEWPILQQFLRIPSYIPRRSSGLICIVPCILNRYILSELLVLIEESILQLLSFAALVRIATIWISTYY